MKLIFYGHSPRPQGVYENLGEAPEGVPLFLCPYEDTFVPVARVGNRLLYLEPDGVYRYWVTYEEERDFPLPPARGDALVAFFDPQQQAFGLEVWSGKARMAHMVLHQGPLALEAARSVFGGRREPDAQ
ncbi:hypothetical protein [Thermus caldilimi]|uniref:hypothetical protein n=1 Tax=Thermus caldilimi TaxID=2483360 RepID=UPI00142D7D61|nr:hypothetical protein [Thermus caldilimi]